MLEAQSEHFEPDPLHGLVEGHRAFVLAYAEHGDGPRAAEQAGYERRESWRLLRARGVVAALEQMRGAIAEAQIANVRECQAALTEIVRDRTTKAADRIAAANTILKVAGALGPEAWVDARTQTVQVVIGADAPLDMLDMLDVLSRLAAGVTVDPSEAAALLARVSPQNVLDVGSDLG